VHKRGKRGPRCVYCGAEAFAKSACFEHRGLRQFDLHYGAVIDLTPMHAADDREAVSPRKERGA
jgi:hypothetical protein